MRKKKIATNIPSALLSEASKLSGLNQTQTIIQGLRELVRIHKIKQLIALRGKIKIEYNPKVTRGR